MFSPASLGNSQSLDVNVTFAVISQQITHGILNNLFDTSDNVVITEVKKTEKDETKMTRNY